MKNKNSPKKAKKPPKSATCSQGGVNAQPSIVSMFQKQIFQQIKSDNDCMIVNNDESTSLEAPPVAVAGTSNISSGNENAVKKSRYFTERTSKVKLEHNGSHSVAGTLVDNNVDSPSMELSSSKLSLKRKRTEQDHSKFDETRTVLKRTVGGDARKVSSVKKAISVKERTRVENTPGDETWKGQQPSGNSQEMHKTINNSEMSLAANKTTKRKIGKKRLKSSEVGKSESLDAGIESGQRHSNDARVNSNLTEKLNQSQSQVVDGAWTKVKNKTALEKSESQETKQEDQVSEVDRDDPTPGTSSQDSRATEPGVDTGDSPGVTERDLDDSESRESGEVVYLVPYYLENFLLILDTVLADEYYCSLFNMEDMEAISKFQGLTEGGQKLYVRLFQRNHRWLLSNRIQYPKIAEDLSGIFVELVESQLLMDSSKLTDLTDILNVLPAPEIRTLAKSLKLGGNNTQKEGLLSAILKHSQQGGIGAFFSRGASKNNNKNMIQKRATSMLGACYKLAADCRRVFMRVIMLFGLHRTRGDEDEEGGGQQFVFQMLMSTIGRIKYAEYTVCREARVFKDRDAFLRFGAALQIETDMSEALAAKNYADAETIYASVRPVALSTIQDPESVEYDLALPDHLQVYTSGSVYTRVLSQGVELLQFQKKYREAVDQLEQLLDPGVYQPDYRGRWYDRLALNLDHHLKEHNKALDMILKALADQRVRTGHRLSLLQRAQRICNSHSKNKTLHKRWAEFEEDPMNSVKEAPKVTIEGCRVSCGQQGPLYIHGDRDDPDSVTLLKHVEDVALVHYKGLGYSQGIHGEGGTFRCLFALYMWDIIFCDGIPDTFYNPFQTFPLDWHSDSFYVRRKLAIDDRLEQIENADTEGLDMMLEWSWDQHRDVLCMGMNWDRFTDVEHAKGLVRCMGPKALAAILGRLARHMRNTTGGVPDLAVWNPDTASFKMVEVKGPGDRLSTKQILWLDFLLECGVDAEVCHVQAISSKKIRT